MCDSCLAAAQYIKMRNDKSERILQSPTFSTVHMPVEREHPRILRRLRATTMPTTRQRMLSAVLNSTDRILTFDLTTLELKTFHWFVITLTFARCNFNCLGRPMSGTERLPPDAWREHRKSHHFLGPCCLCPLFQRLGEKPRYVEAAVHMVMRGMYQGEYVAQCARDKCGYMGWSFFSLKIKFA